MTTAFILVVIFYAGDAPHHVDHIDSIRFDSREACLAVKQIIDVNLENSQQNALVMCRPAG